MMPCYRLCTSVLLWLAAPAAAQTTPRTSDSSFVRWARSNAIVLGSVDRPYADTAYTFVRPLVGRARILALGETIHGGHEPLQFRNQVIKYAVTHLGFTAVALESGLTEGDLVDDYIHGIHDGTGIDSVARAGLTYGFGYLPEDRELIAWLHDHNAHAAHQVSFYGVDLTGGDDYNGVFPGAPAAISSALAFLQDVAPTTSAAFRTRLAPFVGRFTPPHYHELSSLERSRLRAGLDTLYRTMRADSSREVRASSPRRYARALRNAWMAERLNDVMRLADTTLFNAAQAALRDSLIAEDTRWALRQEGTGGRLVLFAHDGHIMNARNDFGHADVPAFRSLRGYAMAGHYLRTWFANDLVIVASTASGAVVRRYWVNGAAGNPSDMTSFDAALALVGHPAFVLDLRRADTVPTVATMLGHPWLFRLQTFFEDVVPRNAFDAVVYFDQITPSKDDVRDVDPQLMLYTDKHDGPRTSSLAK